MSKKCCIFAVESPTSGFRGWEVSPLGKPMFDQRPQSRLSRHIKKAFIALCSDGLKLRNFQRESGLSNGRCPTGYRMSLLYLWGTHFAHCHMCARVYHKNIGVKVLLYSAWASALSVLFPKAMRRPQSVERQQSDSTLFLYA